MSYLVLGLILLTVTLSACAQLALKVGVSKQKMQHALELGIFDGIMAAALSPMILLGLTIYVLSVAMWLWVLSKVDLSVAYPFVGISFLVTMAFGSLLLNESVTLSRIAGTVLIFAGCILVARSA
jgi:multidrug transporter EmrE-like cation transporter